MKKQISPKIVSLVFGILVICFAVGFYIYAAWTEPTEAPPGGNVPAPVNTGGDPQYKTGTLRVAGLTADGETHLAWDSGNVGIGTTEPDAKLDVSGNIGGVSINATDDICTDLNGGLCLSSTALPICPLGDRLISTGTGWGCETPTYYYSLDYLARKYSSFGGVSWYDLVLNSNVINADTNCIYSSTQGNWLPSDTHVETLRLNVDCEKNQDGSDPRSGFQVKYRVWDNNKVTIQSKTWGNHGNVKLNRTDTFQRQSDTVILINGSPQTIAVGATYEIQRFNWNPGDNGSGYSFLRIINVSSGYFDVHQEVWEYDEQYNSAYTKIDSYIEEF